MLNIIIDCEESQEVCKAFRQKGFNAFSCDLQECSGGHPEWHLRMDGIEVLKAGHLTTQSGEVVFIDKWNLLIGHPPCTFMSKAGARWMYPTAGNICSNRLNEAKKAKAFFMEMLNSEIEFIGLENPLPLKVVELPNHTQAIQPYEFGHPFSKKTLLWLKNLPALLPTFYVNDYKPYLPSNTGGGKRGHKATFVNISKKDSSKTFSGIAKAMAEQWGDYILKNKSC